MLLFIYAKNRAKSKAPQSIKTDFIDLNILYKISTPYFLPIRYFLLFLFIGKKCL